MRKKYRILEMRTKRFFNFMFYASLLLVITSCTQWVSTEITESKYLKEDSVLWMQFEIDSEKLSQKYQSGNVSKDSMYKAWDELYQKASKKNVELALKYVTVPSGLQRMYMVRDDIAKDLLEEKLSILPDSLKDNKYAQYIRKYIDATQVEAGNLFVPFECKTPDGKSFDWNTLKGKHFLLVFDGLYCMGKSGRGYLKEMLEKTDRNQFELIVYLKCRTLEDFKEEAGKFSQFKLISDFHPEGSPMNILYKCQATPTCFMIDRYGTLQFVSNGVNPEKFDDYLQNNGCKY